MSPTPSSSPPAPAGVQVVTTTVYAPGTTGVPVPPPASGPPKSPVPISAIAGGVAGGVVLAFIAVVAWTTWGRKLRRQEAKQRKELHDTLAVRENTRRNASSARPRSQYEPKLSANPDGRRVKFLPKALQPAAAPVHPTAQEKGKQREEPPRDSDLPAYGDDEKLAEDEPAHEPAPEPTSPPASTLPSPPIPVLRRNSKPPVRPSPLSSPPISAPSPPLPASPTSPVLPVAKHPSSPPPPPRRTSWILPSDTPPVMPRAKSVSSSSVSPPSSPPPKRSSWVLPSDSPPVMPRPKSTGSTATPPKRRLSSNASVLSATPLSRETRARMSQIGMQAPVLENKASGVSDDSRYSTQSGEAHISPESMPRRLLSTLRGGSRGSTRTQSTGSVYSEANE
ncbi:hypothetical protein BV25DRAFT_1916138 [Artomyces pyxidatus]|uniref:Uncharacterized protein n=1 Tax=Artomyces pyxidatus TaxID=48021 RepID=A0ACB8T172_9AGAM|nr:hypothetical protein BV25DRAFT_1916138 [Artomyces pyxidatus]